MTVNNGIPNIYTFLWGYSDSFTSNEKYLWVWLLHAYISGYDHCVEIGFQATVAEKCVNMRRVIKVRDYTKLTASTKLFQNIASNRVDVIKLLPGAAEP